MALRDAAAVVDAELRAHLVPASQLARRAPPAKLSSGSRALDQVLRGGWVRGGINELCGPRSSGRTSLLYGSLAAAMRQEEAVALVDLHGALDAQAALHLGLDLARLLWVRVEPDQALKAADLLLSAGGYGLLALDLGTKALRVPTAAWQRLQRAAEKHRTALLVSATASAAGFLAATSVQLRRRQVRFEREGGPLFTALEVQPSLVRQRFEGAVGDAQPANENGPPLLSLVPFHVRRLA